MRRTLVLATLLVASCSTPPEPPAPSSRPAPIVPIERGTLIGLSAGDLVQRLGSPALQIREGAGLKLQFRGRFCVLDAYLYAPPSGQGLERVTHVDARNRAGADIDQRGCVAELTRA